MQWTATIKVVPACQAEASRQKLMRLAAAEARRRADLYVLAATSFWYRSSGSGSPLS